MRIGIVAQWFNRGQGTVARHLRSALDSIGHETFVLARPTGPHHYRPGHIRSDGVWAQERVTHATAWEIPASEYKTWTDDHRLEIVFFDQNYEFDKIRTLRERGVRTIGRFVWEIFGSANVEEAQAAFDTIYSLTDCEHRRYLDWGIRSPRIRWGCHPELIHDYRPRSDGEVRFFYPANYMARKPTGSVLEAFRRVKAENARLIVKALRPLRSRDLVVPTRAHEIQRLPKSPADEGLGATVESGDGRVRVITDDLSIDAYRDLFRSSDVCLGPSRWEGLGLHVYESIACGLPLIVNDIPPMNEIVKHKMNGFLVESLQIGATRSGVPACEPKVESLVGAIEALMDPNAREELRAGVTRTRANMSWTQTVEELRDLVEGAA